MNDTNRLLKKYSERMNNATLSPGQGVLVYTGSVDLASIRYRNEQGILEGKSSEDDVINHRILLKIEEALEDIVYRVQQGKVYDKGPKSLGGEWNHAASFPHGPFMFTLWFRRKHLDISFALDCAYIGETNEEFSRWWSIVTKEDKSSGLTEVEEE